MMRNIVMAAALVLVAAGCGNDIPADGEMDTIDNVTKDDGTFPLGNYVGQVAVGQIRDLTLNHDKSYLRFAQTIDCIPAPCRAEQGNYKFSHSSTKRYIRFYDADGNFIDRYTYKLSGDKLSLKADHYGDWFYLTKTDRSTLDEQCGGFVATVHSCAEGLDCLAGNLPDEPGHCAYPIN
jgi:hypothetical protein